MLVILPRKRILTARGGWGGGRFLVHSGRRGVDIAPGLPGGLGLPAFEIPLSLRIITSLTTCVFRCHTGSRLKSEATSSQMMTLLPFVFGVAAANNLFLAPAPVQHLVERFDIEPFPDFSAK